MVRVLAHIHNKAHITLDINTEKLYKNRLKKSLFVMLSIIGAFSLISISFYLKYEFDFTIIFLLNIINLYIVLDVLIGLWILPYHPNHYGLNTNKLKLNLVYIVVFGIPAVSLCIFARYILVKNGQNQFNFNPSFKLSYLLYPIFALTQEIVLKGFVQSYFVVLFDKKPIGIFFAIFIASSIFAMFHLIFGFPVFLATFIFGFCTGLIYEKTRSLLGITVLHVLCGFAMINFSNMF